MRASRCARQRRVFEEKVRDLHQRVVVAKAACRSCLTMEQLKILQGSYRIFEAALDPGVRDLAASLFAESSRQSKAASGRTQSLNAKETLEADIRRAHMAWHSTGAQLAPESEEKISSRLRTSYGSLAKAPPDLLNLLVEARGGTRTQVAMRKQSQQKLLRFKEDVQMYATRLAAQEPSGSGVMTTQEARRLAARHTTFGQDLDAATRQAYDDVYGAYLARNGPRKRRKGEAPLQKRKRAEYITDGPAS